MHSDFVQVALAVSYVLLLLMPHMTKHTDLQMVELFIKAKGVMQQRKTISKESKSPGNGIKTSKCDTKNTSKITEASNIYLF